MKSTLYGQRFNKPLTLISELEREIKLLKKRKQKKEIKQAEYSKEFQKIFGYLVAYSYFNTLQDRINNTPAYEYAVRGIGKYKIDPLLCRVNLMKLIPVYWKMRHEFPYNPISFKIEIGPGFTRERNLILRLGSEDKETYMESYFELKELLRVRILFLFQVIRTYRNTITHSHEKRGNPTKTYKQIKLEGLEACNFEPCVPEYKEYPEDYNPDKYINHFKN